MAITPEQRTAINRQNAQMSTGPRTPEGKAKSRTNALKHGLTALLVDLPDPAEKQRLEVWINDLKPQNVLEFAMVKCACRAATKLDRCARYEMAREVQRKTRPPENPGISTNPLGTTDAMAKANQLGALLLFTLDPTMPTAADFHCEPDPPGSYDELDDPTGSYRSLCQFPEGVNWLIHQWEHIRPALASDDEVKPDGPFHFLVSSEAMAIRLFGLRPDKMPLPQPMTEAADAEIQRLKALHAKLSGGPDAQLKADLALFDASPESQLLIRYEAAAERNLHQAVNTFMKLRQHPELFEVEPEPAPAPEVLKGPPTEAERARMIAMVNTLRKPPPVRNEPTASEHPNPDSQVNSPRAGSPESTPRPT